MPCKIQWLSKPYSFGMPRFLWTCFLCYKQKYLIKRYLHFDSNFKCNVDIVLIVSHQPIEQTFRLLMIADALTLMQRHSNTIWTADSRFAPSQWETALQSTGPIPGLRPANERRRYFVTTSLIGWGGSLDQHCGGLWILRNLLARSSTLPRLHLCRRNGLVGRWWSLRRYWIGRWLSSLALAGDCESHSRSVEHAGGNTHKTSIVYWCMTSKLKAWRNLSLSE